MSNHNPKHTQIPFDDIKEQRRLERVEKLLGSDKRITTAARLFDYAKATAIANPKIHT